jgi:hypothetical protein
MKYFNMLHYYCALDGFGFMCCIELHLLNLVMLSELKLWISQISLHHLIMVMVIGVR